MSTSLILTGEVRFQQLPLDAVLAALTFAYLAHLVGVLDKGLGASGEGAAMQVLAPPRTVAQVEIPVGGNLGGGVDGPLAG